MKAGAALILKLAEDFHGCEVYPINVRHLINFDAVGCHRAQGSRSKKTSSNRSRAGCISLNSVRKESQSVNRAEEECDIKVGGISTTLIVLADADDGSIPIVINLPVLAQDHLGAKKLVIVPIPGLKICDIRNYFF